MEKRLLVYFLISALVLSLTGCKNQSEKTDEGGPLIGYIEEKNEETVEVPVYDHLDRELPEEGKVIDFSDGSYSFAMIDEINREVGLGTELSIEQVNGQNVLMGTRTNGGDAGICIDLSSMLGDAAPECKSFSVDIGIVREVFMSASGEIETYVGKDNQMITCDWSIYDAGEAVKTYTIELPEEGFVCGTGNGFVIKLTFDPVDQSSNKYHGTGMYADVFIDNIIAYDAEGNPLELDSNVVINPPEEKYGYRDWGNQLVKPKGETEIDRNGVTCDRAFISTYKYYDNPNEIFSENIIYTVYYEEVFYGDYQAPYMILGISDVESRGSYATYYEEDILKYNYQTVRVYCVEAEDKQGNKIDAKENYINKSHTICQFTTEQIDSAVYNALYNSECPEYNENLTEEQRADYYANWRAYTKTFGVSTENEYWVSGVGRPTTSYTENPSYDVLQVTVGTVE